MVLAGTVIAQAALLAGLHAAQSGSYSAQVRGAFTRSDVVLSEEPVDYPYVSDADVLVCLSLLGLENALKSLKRGGLLILDGTLITNETVIPEGIARVLSIPATSIASELGKPQAANMVLLGALVKATGLFTDEILQEAVKNSVAERYLDLNLQCVAGGRRNIRQ